MDDLVRDIHETLRAYAAEAEKMRDAAGNPYYRLKAYCADYGVDVTVTFPRPKFYQPPRDAERKYGLTGIAAHYVLPAGLTAVELQAYAEVLGHATRKGDVTRENANDRLGEVFAALTARNPALAALTPDPAHPEALHDTLIGIASDCNVADIRWFNENDPADALQHPCFDRFRQTFGNDIDLTWMPSPETMAKIEKQLLQKQAFKAAPAETSPKQLA